MPVDFLWQLAGAAGPWTAFLALLAYVLASNKTEKDEMRKGFALQAVEAKESAKAQLDEMRASAKTQLEEMRANAKAQMDTATRRETEMRENIRVERETAARREESILERLEQTTTTFDRACEVHRSVASNLPRMEASIQKLSETVDRWIDRDRLDRQSNRRQIKDDLEQEGRGR